MRSSPILSLTPAGLYCPPGEFYIDPVRPVSRAVVTHGHADHARAGHDTVLATPETLAVMGLRYGKNFTTTQQCAAYAERVRVGDVTVTLYPAGHVLGSAQVLIERAGERAVVSGDYKRQADPTCAPFELVQCDLFVTEATFGLPVFRHPEAADEVAKLIHSLSVFPERVHLVGAYAFGKAQRLMAHVREAGYDRPIFLHGALMALTDFYTANGLDLGEVRAVKGTEGKTLAGALVLCPPSALADRWAQRFGDTVTGFASGWMRVRARARQRGVELPMVISDHADWEDLCTTIVETGASQVWVTHGQEDALCHWSRRQGIDAKPLNLLGYGDGEDGDGLAVHESEADEQPPIGR